MSTKELENDHVDLIHFIEEDKKHGEERAEEEKRQQKLKNDKEDRLKTVEAVIAATKSEIDKSKDALGQLVGAQQFVVKVLSDVDQNKYEENKRKYFNTRAKYKEMWIKGAETWVEKRIKDYIFGTFLYEDDVVFDHDEEIHGNQRCELLDEWIKESLQTKKTKQD